MTKTPDLPARDPNRVRSPSPPLEPGLYVVATPIGNLGDITRRAADILARADLILAEDTRVTAKLLNALGVRTPMIAYHDHSGPEPARRALTVLGEGGAAALVSDAGTPLVSDPGYRLVRAAIEAGFPVRPAPGPSAVLAALSVSGLPTDKFLFGGFLPAKSAARRASLMGIAAVPATLVLFETGPRLASALADMAAILGPRPAVVAREVTKLFEEFRRAPLDALAAHYAEAGPPKGEIVVMVGPPADDAAVDQEAVDSALRDALSSSGVKDAARAVAERFGVSVKEAYARALALKSEGS